MEIEEHYNVESNDESYGVNQVAAKFSEFEKLNGVDVLTSNEVFDSIQMYDRTVEIVGYVDGMEAPRYIGDKLQYNFFKFYLNNGNGKRVQVVAWNELVDRIEHHIKSNHIIHLDGVMARMPKIAHFNNGNVPYELQICSNTVVSNLGKYELITQSYLQPERIKFSEVINTSVRVILVGYVKTNFAPVHHNKFNKFIGCGSLTDGEYKLQVHIMNFDEEEYNSYGVIKGDKIEAIGVMQTTEPPYFLVQSSKDLKRIDGHMSLTSVIKVARSLKKRKSEENSSQSQNKKSKID